jgi:hypothetical protein
VVSVVGSIARAPIAVVGIASVFGVHVAPPSVDFHTPPSAAPTKIVFALEGRQAIELIRPA